MKIPQRLFAGSVVAILVGTSIPAYSVPQVKPGTTCKILKQSVVSQGKTFTCVKAGKKLVWDKGVVQVKPAVSVPQVKPSPTPITTPAPTAAPINPIRVAAYKSVQAHKCNSSHPNFTYSRESGASIPEATKKAMDELFERDMNCFTDLLDNPVTLKAFYLTEKDEEFVKKTVEPALTQNDVAHLNQIMDEMKGGKWGSEGTAGGFVAWAQDHKSINFVLHLTNNYKWSEVSSKLVSHEFAHVLQLAIRTKIPLKTNEDWYKQIPAYFVEGGAETLGYLFEMKTIDVLDAQMKKSQEEFSRDPQNASYKRVSSDSDMAVKMQELTLPTAEGALGMQYPVGALMCEYLVATYGFDKYLQILKNTGTYSDFKENLSNTIGISQEQFFKDAAPYVYSQWKTALKL